MANTSEVALIAPGANPDKSDTAESEKNSNLYYLTKGGFLFEKRRIYGKNSRNRTV